MTFVECTAVHSMEGIKYKEVKRCRGFTFCVVSVSHSEDEIVIESAYATLSMTNAGYVTASTFFSGVVKYIWSEKGVVTDLIIERFTSGFFSTNHGMMK